ncbi:MAG: hypothetical protein H6744_04555 [Deltaproteobacteria bacterium]|nr:hypothetical protein [Deltaproteobacteria bacterium]MCB9785946.1 hypothetical protein [Deltaproteobacteria bacterium]
MATASVAWLVSVGGLSPQEARRVTAAFALALAALRGPVAPALKRAEDVVGSVLHLATSGVEELWLISVDPGLRTTGRRRVALGGRASCAIDPVDVLRAAIEDGASGLFVLHNHPSGDPTPSDADLRFTRRLEQQSSVLGLTLHDHLVIAGARWASCVSGAAGTLATPTPSEGERDEARADDAQSTEPPEPTPQDTRTAELLPLGPPAALSVVTASREGARSHGAPIRRSAARRRS